MDSDHSSASHLDLLESDLNRAVTDVIFTSTLAVEDSAAPPTTTPPTTTPSGFRRCACGRRMSSKTHDHHAFCVTCRELSM